MSDNAQLTGLCDRFRGFYPVVIDVETAGFNAKTDALLEIAAITLKMDEQGWLMPDTTLHFHVEPFVGANLQPEALAFNGIDPNDPDRGAVSERASLKRNPFHPFATFDTAALAGLALGQTVLSKACQTAGMDFDSTQAHSALYDTERTAVLFCEIVNRWKRLGGWPLPAAEEV